MRLVLFIYTLLFFQSCLNPDQINHFVDSDMQALDFKILTPITENQQGRAKKSIELDGIVEIAEMAFDTLLYQKDLQGLLDISFSKVIQETNYTKELERNKITYNRKPSESNGPIQLVLTMGGSKMINRVEVSFADSNFLYQSNRTFLLTFNQSGIQSYHIQGNQKILGLDASTFDISTKVND